MATLTQWLASVLLSSYGGDGAGPGEAGSALARAVLSVLAGASFAPVRQPVGGRGYGGQSALEALVSTVMAPARAHAGVVEGAVPLPTQQGAGGGVVRAPLRRRWVPRVDTGGGIRLVAPNPAVAAVPYGGQEASAHFLKNISDRTIPSGADAAVLPRPVAARHQGWAGRAGGLGTGAHTLRLPTGMLVGAGAGGSYHRPLHGLVHLLGHAGVRSASTAMRHAVVRTLQQEYAAWPEHNAPSPHAGLMAHVVPPGVLGADWGAKGAQALALPAVPAQYLHATSQAVGFASTVAPARVQPGPAVQAQITVNATGSTPRAIGDELERRMDTLRMQARQANLGQF